MTIKELCERSFETAQTKGFWDKDREIGTLLMLITSELGEALEADRNNIRTNKKKLKQALQITDTHKFKRFFEENIKDTFEDELADVFIRLGDLCQGLNIDIEKHLELKMKYNQTRKHKHGKNY